MFYKQCYGSGSVESVSFTWNQIRINSWAGSGIRIRTRNEFFKILDTFRSWIRICNQHNTDPLH